MITRVLEKKNYLRASVEYAEVENISEYGLLLRTFSVLKQKNPISSADSQMLIQQKLASLGEITEGWLKIDICSDEVIRVRYTEGTDLPENNTPMVAGTYPGPKSCFIEQSGGTVDISTDKVSVKVNLKPYSIEMTDRVKQNKISIGGAEKDFFNHWDSVNTGLCYTNENEKPIAVENFTLASDECIYGLGEKFIKLNKVGQTIDLDMIDALGVTTPRTYKNIPFYVSTHGYGVFFNHSSLMTFWIGSMSACDVQVAIEDDFLDYYIFMGDIKEVLASYTQLTGRGEMPPAWSYGYWQSKISYSAADEVIDVVKNLRKNQIPCDVIHLDTFWFKKDWFCDLEFDKERFPDEKGFIKELAQMGINVSLWQLPYIPEGSPLFESIKKVDGFVKDKNGEIYDCKVCFVEGFEGIVGVVDYTNPEAVEVHKEAFRRLFRLGVKVIKTDFGEAAPSDGIYFDGTSGHRMHNLYPLLYNKALTEVTKEMTGSSIVWARSAWAGSQRYPLHWGGDNSPNFNNIIPQLTGGLSFGLSGFQFWSQDIGGFLGDTNDELLIRWMQFGVFLSHARIHGSGIRELYKFRPETVRICRDYIGLRYKLLPYLLGSSMKCLEESLPMARALVVEYQDDPNVWNICDQYLFGDSIMVAPIYNQENKRRVYLPKGTWTDWWTGERRKGGIWLDIEADIEKLPLYIREGGIIPMGPSMNYVNEIKTHSIDLTISLFESENRTEFKMPVNDELIDVSYNFSNGIHTVEISKSQVEIKVKTLGSGTVVIK